MYPTITNEVVTELTPREEVMTQTAKPYLILVGIDYSTTSELALERALELAAALPNAELHVVHVACAAEKSSSDDNAESQTLNAPFFDQQAYQELQTYVAVSLGAFEKKRNGSPVRAVRVVSHLRVHAPAHEIAQLAADLEADLVVVGMYGRGTVTRFFLGSIAESVTRLAPCPVLVFRPKGLPPEYPKIEAPCPRCLAVRTESAGKEYWCEQHRERHGQRHVYVQTDRTSQNNNLPLFFHGATGA
jgi:nucleotide-binding universal stress UspA family protein